MFRLKPDYPLHKLTVIAIITAMSFLPVDAVGAQKESRAIDGIDIAKSVVLALEMFRCFSATYSYSYTAGEGLYLESAVHNILRNLRAGNDPVSLDELIKNNTWVKVNTGSEKGEISWYAGKYKIHYQRRYLGGNSDERAHLFDGVKYYTKSRPGPRWDVVPHQIGSFTVLGKLLERPVKVFNGGLGMIEFSDFTFRDLLNPSEFTLSLIHQEDGTLTLRALSVSSILQTSEPIHEVIEIDLQHEPCSLRIAAVRTYRISSAEIPAIEKKGPAKEAVTEIRFSGLYLNPSCNNKQITLEAQMFASPKQRMGSVSTAELQNLEKYVTKERLNTVALYGVHKFEISDVKMEPLLLDSAFRPPSSPETVIFNYTTHEFE
jgi:hypothetical protein